MTAAAKAPTAQHILRPHGARLWRCTCRAMFDSTAAVDHAFATSGSIEMGGRS